MAKEVTIGVIGVQDDVPAGRIAYLVHHALGSLKGVRVEVLGERPIEEEKKDGESALPAGDPVGSGEGQGDAAEGEAGAQADSDAGAHRIVGRRSRKDSAEAS